MPPHVLSDATDDGPLTGLRVIDAGSFIAAPLTAALLADQGADVVKVEPLGGDPVRYVGAGGERAMSATFLTANRGKRSIALDMSEAEGTELLRDLVHGADVLVHNMPSTLARRLRIDEDSLALRAPNVASCRITAFGDEGPLAGRRGLDPVVQAMAGIASMTGDPEGEPTRCAAPVVDVATAYAAFGAVTTALVGRAAGRRPQPVTLALYDVALMLQGPLIALRSMLGHAPPRMGNGSFALLGDQFATSDGHIALAVWDEERWEALCDTLGIPAVACDPRFATARARAAAYADLRPLIAEAVLRWDATALESRLLEADIACGVTATLDQVAAHPHPLETGVLYEQATCGGLDVQLVGGSLVARGTRRQASTAPPALGAQGREVLREVLGLSADRITDLERRSVVQSPPLFADEGAARVEHPPRQGAPEWPRDVA